MEYEITKKKGKEKVIGRVYRELFGLDKRQGGWTITHLTTGMAIKQVVASFKDAMYIVDKLLLIDDFKFKTRKEANSLSPELILKIKEIIG